MKINFLKTCALGVLVSTVFLMGCSSTKKNLQGDCANRFDKLHAKYLKKKYSAAKEGYAEFVTGCAGTEHTEQAYFELCESKFALKDWMEAEQEYGSFLKEFPSSKKYEELARYRLAQSMARQTEGPQRDQTKTVSAIQEFETYLSDFPDVTHGDTVKTELDRLHQLLAERDIHIAKLYRRMDENLAAIIYYKHILKTYGDRIPKRDITLKLVECYIDLKQFIEAETHLTQFDGVAKDDPFLIQLKEMRVKLELSRTRYAKEKKAEKEEAQKPQPM